ncbi:hypothetical protein SAMN05216282_11143 [Cryobacterium psychrotolerans]|uniref:Uncharacterized protein n=1 Tax=Cryobacterium psychrotolerans TaxID=386301 RepID=A0A1G9E6A9_9MICO|nr:hypothetical protein [Cryobacterium psychrotolerans]TFD86409.1 hypothetical protein E3T56_07445 [Cryobacterium psychrotolerans]SDK71597.1 hypothetical protein SAMN05216282_11143 [Cryobacterium psychrotolerans]
MARPSQGITQGVRIETMVPREVNAAIESLVAMSGGTSKATFVRQALLAGLQPYGLVYPEVAAAFATTKQAGLTNRERK